MLEGFDLEVVLTTANSAAQAWYGYDQGVVSGVIISPDFINVFPETKAPSIQGITASCFSLGNLVGCLIAACYGDLLGRKNTLRTGALISAIGAVLQFSAYSFTQLIIGRVVNGIGNGMNSSTCGMFQAESCRSDRRGKLSVIVVLHNVVFYCIACWATLGCSFLTGGYQWRLPLALQLVPGAFLVSLLPFVPESPRWLLMRGKTDEGLEVIRRYSGNNLSSSDPVVQNGYTSIIGAIRIEQQSELTLMSVLGRRDRSSHLKRLLLGCGGQFMQQFCGINALNYYFIIILTTNVGLTEMMARILTGCNAISYMCFAAMCFWLIERYGRRTLMITGLFLQFFAYVMVAIAIGSRSHAPQQWGVVAVSFLFFYFAVYGCTWGMIPWVYQAEINSLPMRTVGSAAATATNWLSGFICTQFTPTGISNIGFRFYGSVLFFVIPTSARLRLEVFAVFNLSFVAIVYFLYPETAYRTLEDMDVYFDRDSNHPTIIPISDKATKRSKRPQEFIDAETVRVSATRVEEAKGAAEGFSLEHVEHNI